MFTHSNAYKKFGLKHILHMPDRCPVCNQKYEMETGFWYGTGYVSYALTVAISVASFIAWWVLIGLSINDKRIYGWLAFNAILLFVIQPWLMRISRVIYLYFFVRYDAEYKTHDPQEFDA
jgi:hypothetical protein